MSKFKCKKHGVKGIILVSPDIASNIKMSISIREMTLKPINVETESVRVKYHITC